MNIPNTEIDISKLSDTNCQRIMYAAVRDGFEDYKLKALYDAAHYQDENGYYTRVRMEDFFELLKNAEMTPEQVALFSSQEITSRRMAQLKKALNSGVPMENIEYMAKMAVVNQFDSDKLEQLRLIFEDTFSAEKIESFVKVLIASDNRKYIDSVAMEQARLAIRNGRTEEEAKIVLNTHNVSYFNGQSQSELVRLTLEKGYGVDNAKLVSEHPFLSEQIFLALEDGRTKKEVQDIIDYSYVNEFDDIPDRCVAEQIRLAFDDRLSLEQVHSVADIAARIPSEETYYETQSDWWSDPYERMAWRREAFRKGLTVEQVESIDTSYYDDCVDIREAYLYCLQEIADERKAIIKKINAINYNHNIDNETLEWLMSPAARECIISAIDMSTMYDEGLELVCKIHEANLASAHGLDKEKIKRILLCETSDEARHYRISFKHGLTEKEAEKLYMSTSHKLEDRGELAKRRLALSKILNKSQVKYISDAIDKSPEYIGYSPEAIEVFEDAFKTIGDEKAKELIDISTTFCNEAFPITPATTEEYINEFYLAVKDGFTPDELHSLTYPLLSTSDVKAMRQELCKSHLQKGDNLLGPDVPNLNERDDIPKEVEVTKKEEKVIEKEIKVAKKEEVDLER